MVTTRQLQPDDGQCFRFPKILDHIDICGGRLVFDRNLQGKRVPIGRELPIIIFFQVANGQILLLAPEEENPVTFEI